MKQTHRCPKCDHDRILHIATVADRLGEWQHSEESVPMKLARVQTPSTTLGMASIDTQRVGELEAAVCPRCGYTELYAKDPSELKPDGTNIRELVASGGSAAEHR